MAKRFTATEKWEDAWFTTLNVKQKLFWLYLLDKCDHAGIWEKNFRVASFLLGFPVDDNFSSYLRGKILEINSSKWFIPKFILFQYGELSETCRPHIPVIKQLERYNLKGYLKGIDTLQEQEQEQVKEQEQENIKGDPRKEHPLQKKIREEYPQISKLKSQLTYEEAVKLSGESEGTLTDILNAMENKADLLKKYKSVYLTICNWLKIRKTPNSDGKNFRSNSGFNPNFGGGKREIPTRYSEEKFDEPHHDPTTIIFER